MDYINSNMATELLGEMQKEGLIVSEIAPSSSAETLENLYKITEKGKKRLEELNDKLLGQNALAYMKNRRQIDLSLKEQMAKSKRT